MGNSLQFLSGGGKMGELIRSYNWSETSLGNPETWPQSLRTAVRIMLDCPFGMYIAWGKEYVQLYNDGYRPILGATKHPQALGISTRITFEEVWPTIGPMFEGVMQGTPIGFPDFVLHLDRNGFVEECIFDFSYSPIRLENGEVFGVLVTVIETTEKAKALQALKNSEQELQFAIEATDLGTWDLNPATNKFSGNSRLKEWFGLNPDDEIDLNHALAVIIDKDRDKVTAAIETALQHSSGGSYDIIYTIINPQTNKERIVRAKGRASFNVQQIAYRFNGTLQDVSEEVMARRLLTESEQRFKIERMVLYNSFMNAPAGIAIFKGNTHIYEFANAEYENFVKRKIILGKTVQELFPEVEQQGIIEILDRVYATGEPFIANEYPIELKDPTTGNMILGYYNSVLQPLKDENGNSQGLLSHGVKVTQQVEARQQIEASEQRFKTLSETIPHMVWTATPDGKKNYFNQYFLDYTGRTHEELKGEGWHKIIFPEDLEKELAIWEHHINTKEDFKLEKRVRHKSGVYHWHLSHNIPQKNAEGEITGWIGTNTDIEEQKSFTEELEKKVNERTYQLHIQNETFKQAEESSLQGSYSFNLTTGKLIYSDNLYKLIGFDKKHFEPSLEEFNKYVHPDDKDYVTKAAEKVLANKVSDAWHYRMISNSGNIINIKGTGRVIRSANEDLLVGTLQDVTKEFELNRELQEKEEYLNQIIQNAPDAVIVINENNIISLWNPKTEEIFGWKTEEVLGLDLTEIIVPPQYRNLHREGMKRYLNTGVAKILNETLELTGLHKDGKEFPISLTISMAMQQGEKLFIAFLRDISFEKRTIELAIMNQSLINANTELEAAQKLSEKLLNQRDEFISIASHEMKTPLTTVKGYAELLQLSLSEDQPSFIYANKTNQAIERLSNLVSQLLDASKIQNGQLNYNITSFDFNLMMNEMIENFQLDAKNHQIEKQGSCSQPITGDKGRIEQVLINLLSNAVKYSPNANKVIVKIEELNNKIQVSVQDFGIGLSKQHLDKIFSRYYRVKEHAIHFQGLGIGLYISSNIIHRHHGTMWVESTPEKGSTFYFSLPL